MLIGLFVILTTLTAARSVAVTADPELRYTGSAGCGDVFLYGFNQNHTEVLLVRVDLKKLNLGVGTHVVDVADAKEAVTIQVDEYRTPQDLLPYDLVFVNSDGRTLRAPAPIPLTGTVGWVVG